MFFYKQKLFWYLCYLHQSSLKERSTFATFLNQLALIIRPLFTIDRLCLQCAHIYVIAIKVSIWLLQLERHRINVEPSLYSKIIINISWHNHRKIDSSRNCKSNYLCVFNDLFGDVEWYIRYYDLLQMYYTIILCTQTMICSQYIATFYRFILEASQYIIKVEDIFTLSLRLILVRFLRAPSRIFFLWFHRDKCLNIFDLLFCERMCLTGKLTLA